MKLTKTPLLAILGLVVAFAAGCSTDDPSSPTAPPSPPVPPAAGTNVTITVSASELEAGSTGSSLITIRAVRTDNGQPVPNLTQASVTTTLGNFGNVGGPTTTQVELVNGQATLVFFPGDVVGTATIRAQVLSGVALTSINIREPGTGETFFISSVSPNTGSPQGGETVTINGAGFSDPIRVTFNGNHAPIQFASGTQIRVTTPPCSFSGTAPCFAAGATTPADVTVVVNQNEPDQASDTLAGGFIYQGGGGGGVLQPSIFSVTPSSGPNEGGTQVTINGDGFEAPVAVDFGDAGNEVSAQVISVTRTRIVAISPPASGIGAPNLNQLVDIRVTNQSTGRTTRAISAFRYGVAVSITAISPGEGPATGGQLVTIFGQGFDEPVAVSLAGRGQQVISVSGSEIVVRTVPIVVSGCANSSGPTSVTNIETGDSATGPTYTYVVPRPTIANISPNSGAQAGGTPVTITGFNFEAPINVTFDTFSGNVSSVSPGSISVTTPPFPTSIFTTVSCDDDGDTITGNRITGPVSVDVKVTNPVTGCTVTATDAFLVIPTSTACIGD